jgi:caspase domain-containing protein
VRRTAELALAAFLIVVGPSYQIAAQQRDAQPPRIEFLYPYVNAELTTETTGIVARVTDAHAVTSIELSVNGAPVHWMASLQQPTLEMSVNVRVLLKIGENVLTIKATNAAGQTDEVTRIIKRVSVAVTPPRTEWKGERYAVVIGVGQYDDPKIPHLRYAESDARAVYEFLTTKAGYQSQNVLLLVDSSPQKPTLANIKRALGMWLPAHAAKDDAVIVYYAGHGAPEIDQTGVQRDGVSKYLVPRDAEADALYVTAFPVDEVETIFRRLASERVVFLIDASFAGAAGGVGRSFTRQTTRSGHMTKEFLSRLAASKGRFVIAAAAPNEVALEVPDLKHGLFTYYLLKGLEGDADANSDDIVTVNELFNYVQRNVARYAMQMNRKQLPVMSGAVMDLPLVQITKP